MRVLFLSAANNIHTVRWVNALAERNIEVFLVSLPNHKVSCDKISDKIEVIYLPISGELGYYFNAYSLRKIFIKKKIDIVNVHYASGYGTLVRIAKLPKVILTVWGSDVYEFPYRNHLCRYIIKKNIQYADIVTSSSYAMKEQICSLCKKKSIYVIPFGVDTSKFMPQKKKRDNKFVVGTIKTLEKNYGIDVVIKAFACFYSMVKDNSYDKTLVIYGKGNQLHSLKNLCMELNIYEKVEFKGYIPNDAVPSVLSEIDVSCFASRMESFGVSAVESMSCGKPVIATATPGFQEVVDNGITGFICQIDDYASIANKLFYLYKHLDKREQMGMEGRKKVIAYYDWKKNVSLMLEVYQKLMKLDSR